MAIAVHSAATHHRELRSSIIALIRPSLPEEDQVGNFQRQTAASEDARCDQAHSSPGFTGFVPFKDLATADVPAAPGVYVVLRADDEPPVFLEHSPAGWFKERNPSVTAAQLANAWIDAASVLYIGKAGAGISGRRGLKKRLTEYRRHGAGEKIGHWSGRYVWQLAGGGDLLVAWKETPGVGPETVEAELIGDFMWQYGARPFANRKIGKAATQ